MDDRLDDLHSDYIQAIFESHHVRLPRPPGRGAARARRPLLRAHRRPRRQHRRAGPVHGDRLAARARRRGAAEAVRARATSRRARAGTRSAASRLTCSSPACSSWWSAVLTAALVSRCWCAGVARLGELDRAPRRSSSPTSIGRRAPAWSATGRAPRRRPSNGRTRRARRGVVGSPRLEGALNAIPQGVVLSDADGAGALIRNEVAEPTRRPATATPWSRRRRRAARRRGHRPARSAHARAVRPAAPHARHHCRAARPRWHRRRRPR